MRSAIRMSHTPANVPCAVAGACPAWVVDEIARVYQCDPRPALGALLDRLRREPVVRFEITPAGRRAIEEDG